MVFYGTAVVPGFAGLQLGLDVDQLGRLPRCHVGMKPGSRSKLRPVGRRSDRRQPDQARAERLRVGID